MGATRSISSTRQQRLTKYLGFLAGGGAGSAFTANREIFLCSESLLTFRIEHSVHITESQ